MEGKECQRQTPQRSDEAGSHKESNGDAITEYPDFYMDMMQGAQAFSKQAESALQFYLHMLRSRSHGPGGALSILECWHASVTTVQNLLLTTYQQALKEAKEKHYQVYILSRDLSGPSADLHFNLSSMRLEDTFTDVLHKNGVNLNAVYQVDSDLSCQSARAACLIPELLEAASTQSVPLQAYGIHFKYHYDPIKIDVASFTGVTSPEVLGETPYEQLQLGVSYVVEMYGSLLERTSSSELRQLPLWQSTSKLRAVPTDTLICGHRGQCSSRMRLWRSVSCHTRMSDSYTLISPRVSHDILHTIQDKQNSEMITAIPYSREQGELFLKQTYFFVSASIQDVLHRFQHGQESFIEWHTLPQHVGLHALESVTLGLAFAELVRLLMQVYNLQWSQAVRISQQSLKVSFFDLEGFKEDFVLAELLQEILPCHLRIINDFNQDFLDVVKACWGDVPKHINEMTLYEDRSPKRIRMTHLALVCSSGIHVSSIRTYHSLNPHFSQYYDEWRSFHGISRELYVDDRMDLCDTNTGAFCEELVASHQEVKESATLTARCHEACHLSSLSSTRLLLTRVPVAISPRRWLSSVNPRLAKLFSTALKDVDWTVDSKELRHLSQRIGDIRFTQEYSECRRLNVNDFKENWLRPQLRCGWKSANTKKGAAHKCLCAGEDLMIDLHIAPFSSHKAHLMYALVCLHRYIVLRNEILSSVRPADRLYKCTKALSITGGFLRSDDREGVIVYQLLSEISALLRSDSLVCDSFQLLLIRDERASLSSVIPVVDLVFDMAPQRLGAMTCSASACLYNGGLHMRPQSLDVSRYEQNQSTAGLSNIPGRLSLSNAANPTELLMTEYQSINHPLSLTMQFLRQSSLFANRADKKDRMLLLLAKMVSEWSDELPSARDFMSDLISQRLNAERIRSSDLVTWTRLSLHSICEISAVSSDSLLSAFASKCWGVRREIYTTPASEVGHRSNKKLVFDSTAYSLTLEDDCQIERKDKLLLVRTGEVALMSDEMQQTWRETSESLAEVGGFQCTVLAPSKLSLCFLDAEENSVYYASADDTRVRKYIGPFHKDCLISFVKTQLQEDERGTTVSFLSRLTSRADRDVLVRWTERDSEELDEGWEYLKDRLADSPRLDLMYLNANDCTVDLCAPQPPEAQLLLIPASSFTIRSFSSLSFDAVFKFLTQHATHGILSRPGSLVKELATSPFELDSLLYINPEIDEMLDDVWCEVHERLSPSLVNLRLVSFSVNAREPDIPEIHTTPAFYLRSAQDEKLHCYDGIPDTDALMVWLESCLGRGLSDLGKPFHRVAFRTGIDVVLQIRDAEPSRNADWVDLWDELQDRLEGNSTLRFFEWSKPIDHKAFEGLQPIGNNAVFLTRKNSPTSTSIEQYIGPLDIDAMIHWVRAVHDKPLDVKPRSLSREIFRADKDVVMIKCDENGGSKPHLLVIWEEVKRRTSSSANLIMMSLSDKHFRLDVPGFTSEDAPSIYMLCAHSNIPIRYRGENDADDLIAFIKLQATNAVHDEGSSLQDLLTSSRLTTLLLIRSGSEVRSEQPHSHKVDLGWLASLNGYTRISHAQSESEKLLDDPSDFCGSHSSFCSRVSMWCPKLRVLETSSLSTPHNDGGRKVTCLEQGLYLRVPRGNMREDLQSMSHTRVAYEDVICCIYHLVPCEICDVFEPPRILQWVSTHTRDVIWPRTKCAKDLQECLLDAFAYVRIPGESSPTLKTWSRLSERLEHTNVILAMIDEDNEIDGDSKVVFFGPAGQRLSFTGDVESVEQHITFVTQALFTSPFPRKLIGVLPPRLSDVFRSQRCPSFCLYRKPVTLPDLAVKTGWDALMHRCRFSIDTHFFELKSEQFRLDIESIEQIFVSQRNTTALILYCEWPSISHQAFTGEVNTAIIDWMRQCWSGVRDEGISLVALVANERRAIMIRKVPQIEACEFAAVLPASSEAMAPTHPCMEVDREWSIFREQVEEHNRDKLLILDTKSLHMDFDADLTSTGSSILIAFKASTSRNVFERLCPMIQVTAKASDLIVFAQTLMAAALWVAPTRLSRLLSKQEHDTVLHISRGREKSALDNTKRDVLSFAFESLKERLHSDCLAFLSFDRNSKYMDLEAICTESEYSSGAGGLFITPAYSDITYPLRIENLEGNDAVEAIISDLGDLAVFPLMDKGVRLSSIIEAHQEMMLIWTHAGLDTAANGCRESLWRDLRWRLSDNTDFHLISFDLLKGRADMPGSDVRGYHLYGKSSYHGQSVLNSISEVTDISIILKWILDSLPTVKIKPTPLRHVCFSPFFHVLTRMTETENGDTSTLIGDVTWQQLVERLQSSCNLLHFETLIGPLSSQDYSDEDLKIFPYSAKPTLFLTLREANSPLSYHAAWNPDSIIVWLQMHLPTLKDLGPNLSDIVAENTSVCLLLRLFDRGADADNAETEEWLEVEERLALVDNFVCQSYNITQVRMSTKDGLCVDRPSQVFLYCLPLRHRQVYGGQMMADPILEFVQTYHEKPIEVLKKPLARQLFSKTRDVLLKVGSQRSAEYNAAQPEWEELQERVKPSTGLNLIEFDTTNDTPNVAGVARTLAPKIYIVPAGATDVICFEKTLSCENLISFLQQHAVNDVIVVAKPFARVLFNRDKDVLVKVHGREHDVLLDQAWNEVIARCGATERLLITTFDASNTEATIQGFDIGELPAIVFSRAGARMPIAYIGKHQASPILRFLREFASIPVNIAPKSFKAIVSEPGRDVLVALISSDFSPSPAFLSTWAEATERLEMSSNLVLATYDISLAPPDVTGLHLTPLPSIYLSPTAATSDSNMARTLIHYQRDVGNLDALLTFLKRHAQHPISVGPRSFSRSAFRHDKHVLVKVIKSSSGPEDQRAQEFWRQVQRIYHDQPSLQFSIFDCDEVLPDIDGVSCNCIYLTKIQSQALTAYTEGMSLNCISRFIGLHTGIRKTLTDTLSPEVNSDCFIFHETKEYQDVSLYSQDSLCAGSEGAATMLATRDQPWCGRSTAPTDVGSPQATSP